MKNLTKTSVLLCVCGIALILGCKKDEVDPVDKLMGLYQSSIQPVGVLPQRPGGRIRLKKASDGFVLVTAFDVLYRRAVDPLTGITVQYYFKDFEFPKCNIVFIDTTGANNKFEFFAKLIDTNNNVELGKIRYWIDYPKGIKTEYYKLVADFYVNDSTRVGGRLYKWKDY